MTTKVKKVKPQKSEHLLTARFEVVTPEVAGDWLNLNTHNRKMRERRVRRYAEGMMRDGEWMENGETVKFDWNGVLLDGQHRLAAIIYAKTPARILVVRGVDPAAYDSIDNGANRRIDDALHVAGVGDSARVATALSYLWRYRKGGAFSRMPGVETPTNRQIEELLEAEPNIAHHVQFAYSISRKMNIGLGLAALLRYLMCEIDDDGGQLFWEYMRNGTDLKGSSPIYRLRERLLTKGKLPPDEIGAIAIKAWNAHRKGVTLGQLRWSANKEMMPTPE